MNYGHKPSKSHTEGVPLASIRLLQNMINMLVVVTIMLPNVSDLLYTSTCSTIKFHAFTYKLENF